MSALYGFTGKRDHNLRLKIAERLKHRGALTQYKESINNATVGSCISRYNGTPTPSGVYTQGRKTIAFAGTVYGTKNGNYELKSLLSMFVNDGPEFISQLSGGFVMAIVDENHMYLFRDSSGHRTLYYGKCPNRIVFASESKGILVASDFKRSIRPAAIAQYLTFSFIPSEGTMLKNIWELPAGHWLEINLKTLHFKTHRYFYFENKTRDSSLSDAMWIERFKSTLSRVVEQRISTCEPTALFLSGGIDSSVVAVELTKKKPRGVHSYAIHFGKKYPNELECARSVSQRCGTIHREVLIEPKSFLKNLQKIIWHLDDPIGDPVTMPNFELARIVSNDVSYVFNGEGGDPCYGGPKNIPMFLHHWYGGIKRTPEFRLKKYLASYRRAYDEIQALLTPEWQSKINVSEDLEGILKPFLQTSNSPLLLDKLRITNIRLKGAHLILPKIERMLGAWNVTPLSPLFDQEMIRLSFEIPPHLILNQGVEKVILKEAYAAHLPSSIIARPKSGMRVPVHYWFQGELKRYIRSLLHPKKINSVGIFNPNRVKQYLNYATDDGPGRYGLRLWMLLTFEIWRQHTFENNSI